MSYLSDVHRFKLDVNFPFRQDRVLLDAQRDQLNDIIRQEFKIEQMLILVVGPAKQLRPQLAQLGFPIIALSSL